MKKAEVGVGMAAALMSVGAWLAGSGVATATMPIQKKAKEVDVSWLKDYVEKKADEKK